MTDEQTHAARKAEAERRMAGVAQGLSAVLGPLATAGVLIGAGVAVLEAGLGREKAVEYLETLAKELAASGPESQPYGHA